MSDRAEIIETAKFIIDFPKNSEWMKRIDTLPLAEAVIEMAAEIEKLMKHVRLVKKVVQPYSQEYCDDGRCDLIGKLEEVEVFVDEVLSDAKAVLPQPPTKETSSE